MARITAQSSKLARLRTVLGACESASARELAQRLEVSQPVLSRLMAQLRDEVLVMGKARATRYALRRTVQGVGQSLPIYAVESQAETRRVGTLYPLAAAFYVDSDSSATGLYAGLPYFLHDMRPAGFLGRLLPTRHPDFEAPTDIRMWTDDDCLRFFVKHGWDLPGNLLVGEAAFASYLRHLHEPPEYLTAADRAEGYVRHAEGILQSSVAGSSAAGEQPKFLANLAPDRSVLVKFSPPTSELIGQRIADLLWCEHLMHKVLAARGCSSAQSEVLEARGRVFLQVERFDRCGLGGRRGVMTLTSLDLQFVGGDPYGWVNSVKDLTRQGLLPVSLLERVRWLRLVGALIGNNDMHGGNLSFFTRNLQPYDLAPVYDMLPMLYAPYQGNLPGRRLELPMPAPAEARVWGAACEAAEDFWRSVAGHQQISAGFRAVAEENARAVARLAGLGRHLPR